MAGIYLHIPFCKQACHYCNFHFTTSLRSREVLVQAIRKEMELQQDFLEGDRISTIYFGGGTPSLLPVEDCRLLLEKIYGTFSVASDAEITLEANPDDVSKEKLAGWKDCGINRLSIGIQSFFEEELRWMNRAHSAAQSYRCLELSRDAGFHNLNMDLIYGSPLLTDDMWKQNVRTAIGYGVPHLSCYALTVEEKTPLHKQISLHTKENIDAEKAARQFLLLVQWLSENGYEHYEVSNFARPGFRSRHNSSYWTGEKYLGLGPSAHSYNGFLRRWNIANNAAYLRAVHNQEPGSETEYLSPVQQLNEYMMISLRTKEGMNLEKIKRGWGEDKIAPLTKKLFAYQQRGMMTQTGSVVQLTENGLLWADGIAADLFFLSTE